MEQWRLILAGANDAYTNMAIDESVLHSVSQNKTKPTVRFYHWKPSAVSIGYFQSIEDEVDIQRCKNENVDVVRRITGGGAVYHDFNDEITYSIIIHESHEKIPKNIMESYKIICCALVSGFKKLGINAEFRQINDVCVDGKKISGSAQTRRYNTVLQHGTILCDVKPKLMFSLLKVPDEKIRGKMISSVEERVTSIKKKMGDVDIEKVKHAMIKGFEDTFDVTLINGELTETEKKYAEKLRCEKYATKEWIFKR